MATAETGLDLEALRKMREERQKRIEDMRQKSALREQQKKAAAEKTVKPFGLDDLLKADSDTDDTGSTLSPLAAPTRPVTMVDPRPMSEHPGPSRGPHPPLESSTNSAGVLHVRVAEGAISRSPSTQNLQPQPQPSAPTSTPTMPLTPTRLAAATVPTAMTSASPRNQPFRPTTPRPYPAAPVRPSFVFLPDAQHSPPSTVTELIGPQPTATSSVSPPVDLAPPPAPPLPRSDSVRSIEYEVPCVDRATQTVAEMATQTEAIVCNRASCACLHLHPAEPHPRRCAICDGTAVPPARQPSREENSEAMTHSAREWQAWWQKVAVYLAAKAASKAKPPAPSPAAEDGPLSAATNAVLQQRLRRLQTLLKASLGDPGSVACDGPQAGATNREASLVYSPFSTTLPASSVVDWMRPLAMSTTASAGGSSQPSSDPSGSGTGLRIGVDDPPEPHAASRKAAWDGDGPASPTNDGGTPPRPVTILSHPYELHPQLSAAPFPYVAPGPFPSGYSTSHMPYWASCMAPPPGYSFPS
eukprot:GGOE01004611.1.p1 GENE.GGOE01004611.1~~GGOE01004611.1.p1  ORF type:complete len:539 (+),score=78.36 GGOE01004611.1:34-1617(+)